MRTCSGKPAVTCLAVPAGGACDDVTSRYFGYLAVGESVRLNPAVTWSLSLPLPTSHSLSPAAAAVTAVDCYELCGNTDGRRRPFCRNVQKYSGGRLTTADRAAGFFARKRVTNRLGGVMRALIQSPVMRAVRKRA